MAIRAPLDTLHSRSFPSLCLEREAFYETLGCCWALSAKQVNNEFAIEFLIDLSRVNLLYGQPTEQLSESMVGMLLRAFSSPAKNRDDIRRIEHNALELVQSMESHDFLSFHSGMHDAVDQVLKYSAVWTPATERAYLAFRYFSLNLLDITAASDEQKQDVAALLTEFLLTGRRERQVSMGSNQIRYL